MILSTMVSIGAGILTWSFAEYALHNWYGHVPKGKNKFSKEHLTHHAKKDYFAPASEKARMAVPIVGVSTAITMPFFGVYGLMYSLSFVATYLGYEFFHKRCHTHAPKTRFGAFLRKHHFYHHFGNPWKNHGVTSAFWDRVFKTYVKPEIINVPEKFAMRWLIDEHGEIKEEFSQDYQLVRYRKVTRADKNVHQSELVSVHA